MHLSLTGLPSSPRLREEPHSLKTSGSSLKKQDNFYWNSVVQQSQRSCLQITATTLQNNLASVCSFELLSQTFRKQNITDRNSLYNYKVYYHCRK